LGFGWIWLTGSIYWGWLRWEPVVHLPVEALGLPIAIACLRCGRGRVGSYFFLGSLLGTAVTDLYINWMNLFPNWRQLMRVDPDFAASGAAGGDRLPGYRSRRMSGLGASDFSADSYC
jgi:hypothetical protein